MKANELFSNCYYLDTESGKVTKYIHNFWCAGLEFWSNGNCKTLRPISLTEDWLLRFGFEYSERFQSFFKKYESRNIEKQFIITKDFIVCDMDHQPEIKYVHQLQNLYFALIGEELTLKS